MTMRRNVNGVRGRRLSLLRASGYCAVGLITLFQPSTARALDDDPVMRVEEDWELRLNDPGPDVDSPQFHSVMAAKGDMNSYYFQVNWNFREDDDFNSGGLQVTAWRGDTELAARTSRDDQLSTYAETVTWTQAMSTNGENLKFELLNGHSITWGSFGNSSDSRLQGGISLSNLNNYTASMSAQQSMISYGCNRVNLLRIKEVRYYNGDGDMIGQDTTPRVIYSGSGNGNSGSHD